MTAQVCLIHENNIVLPHVLTIWKSTKYKVRLTENIQSLTSYRFNFLKGKGRDDFLIRGLSESQTNALKLLLDAKLDPVQNTKDTE